MTTLSSKTIEIIKSTVPVLQLHGESITKRFYELMFSRHPELLHIFNHANQKQGRQQAALAGAVYAAAAHIDSLEAIVPTVMQIAHKHRSLGIKPEHYPIVGEHLLLAIKDVLGDAATDEIMQAWEQAYQRIAEVFVEIEKNMYKQAAAQVGGWEGFRRFKVVKKAPESCVITSFYLKSEDGGELASFLPGQYLSVKVQIPGKQYTHIRQYSLSDAPGKDYYRISVKREDAIKDRPSGVVSNYLHKEIEEGDVLDISAPAGDFVLDMEQTKPVVLISGGVGLTPIISMLNTLAESQPERAVTFIHAAQNSEFHAMSEHVTGLAERNRNIKSYVCYQAPTEEDRAVKNYDKEGFIDLAWLQTLLPSSQADFYFCGPVPFMSAVNKALKQWGVQEDAIHYEFFGPKGRLEAEPVA